MPKGNDGIGSKVSILGDKEYKAALADISRQLTLLNTDMQASKTAFAGQEESMEALRAKSESLQALYDAHAQKVQLITEQLNKAKGEYGDNSKEADNLQIALNRAQTAMNKIGTELDSTNTKLDAAEKAQSSAAEGYDKVGDAAKASDEKIALLTAQLDASQSAFGHQADTLDGLKDKHEGLQGIYDAHKEKVAALAEELEKAKAAYGDNSKEVGDLQTALANAEKAMNDVGTEVADTEAAVDKMTDAVNESVDENAAMTLTLRDVEKAEKDAAKEAEGAAKDTKGFGDALSVAAGAAAAFTLDAVKAGFEAVADLARKAGEGIVTSLKTFADYDDGMKQVQATMGLVAGSGAEADASIRMLDQAAKDAGANTMFTSRDAADALNYLALAGYDAERAVDALPRVLNLAAAGGMDLAKASDMVTDAMSALGLTDMDGFMDNLAKTAQKSNTSVEQLGDAYLKLGATGKDVAGGIDEISVLLGVMADNGIKGSEAGTHLRNMILSLTTPTDEAAKRLKDLNVSIYDDNGEMRGMPQVLQELNAAMADMTTEEKTNIISTIFNKTDLATVNALLGTSAERWEDLASEIEDSEGACQQMAETMESGLGGSIRSFQSAAEGLQIAIGQIFSGMAQDMVDSTTGMLRDITGILSDGFQPEDIQAIADVLSGFIGEQLTNIIGLVSGAIPLVGEALNTIVTVLVEQLPGLVETLLPAALGLFQTVIDALADNAEALTTLAVDIVTSLATFLLDNVDKLLEAATGILTGLIDGIIEKLPDLIPLAVKIIADLTVALFDALPQLIARIPEITAAIIEGVAAIDWLQTATDLITGLATALTSIAATHLENYATIFNTLWEKAKDMDWAQTATDLITNLLAALRTVGATMIENVTSIFSGLWEKVKEYDWAQTGLDLIQGLINGITGAVTSLLENVKSVFQPIIDAVKTLFGIQSPSTVMAEIGGFLLSGLVNGLSEAVDAVVEKVKEIFGKIWDAIKAIFGFGKGESEESKEAKQAGKDIMTGMQTGIEDNEETLKGTVKTVSQTVLDTFKTELGIEGNTSTKTKPFGEAAAVGVNDGLTEKSTAATFSGGANAASSAMDSALKSAFGVSGGLFGGGAASKFTYIGDAVAQGIAKGIKDGSGKITEAAKSAANAAYEAAKNELGIESPSKVMREVGLFFDEGFAGGISDGMADVLRSARSLASLAASETASGVGGAMGGGSASGFEIDYDRLGAAVAKANREAGLGNADIYMDKEKVGQAVEPSVSRETYQRSSQNVAGRTARVMLI